MPVADDREQASEPSYPAIFRRHVLLIVMCVVLAIAGAVAVSLVQRPVYVASTKLLIEARNTDPLTGAGISSDPLRVIQTEAQVITSAQVRDLVRAKLGSAPIVTAVPEGQSNILTISARSLTAQRAARLANAYATSYLAYSKAQIIDKLTAARADAQSRLTALRQQISALPGNTSVVTAADRDTLVGQLSLQRQRLDQIDSQRALASAGATVLTAATAPSVAASPRLPRNVALAVVAGLFVGLALALVAERRRERRLARKRARAQP